MQHTQQTQKMDYYAGFPAFFRLSILTIGILGLFPSAIAEDYFDPSFLTLSGDTENVDLSVFTEKGGVAEGEYIVSISVNNQDEGQFSLQFKKNSKGIVTPQLTPELLESWGVNIPNIPKLKLLPAQDPIDNLATYIPQASTKLDLARLRLDISIPQVAMTSRYANYANPKLWDDGISALLFNYNVSAGQNRNHSSGSDTTQNNNLFASVLGGLNVGPWRLRSTITHTHNEYNSQGVQDNRTQDQTRFSNTYLSRDIKSLRSNLLIGEANTGGEIFDSVPFKGIQLRSSEQMLPSQLRGYAPAISGIANSNARITVRQNGNIIYETYVAPGPFYINDIQQAGLSGDYDVIITEANGTTRGFIVPYSALPMMLRPGGWKYEITVGRYDGSLTQGSRQSDFILSTGVYGLPNNMTLFGGVLAAEDYQALTAGSGVSLGKFGAISADITQSISKFQTRTGPSERKTGQSYRVRYSKSLLSTGTSVDLTTLRYSTEHFYNFSEYNSQGYNLEEDLNPWTLQRRRSSFKTQISQQLGQYGTLRLQANRDDYWGNSKTLTGVSFGYTGNMKGVNFGINYNIDRMKDLSGQWPENRQVSINMSIPFRIFGYDDALESIYATSTITHDNHGRTQNQIGLSGSMLESAVSYNVSQSWDNQNQSSMSNASLAFQGSKGSLAMSYSYSGNSRAMNMNVNGGIVIHSGGVTFSPLMGNSIALVSAPEASGAHLTNGNAIIDWQGYAIAPYLSDYMKNNVGIDLTTLPENIDITHSNTNVYPTKGAVVKVNIATRVGYQALISLEQSNQQPVPFGAIATLMNVPDQDTTSGIISDMGQVYLSGLPEKGTILVRWGDTPDRQCQVEYSLSKPVINEDNSIRQGSYICHTENN